MKIDNKEYKIKMTLKALFAYEELTGKPFNPQTTMEMYMYFYCVILVNNPSFNMTFDDFINLNDEHPELFKEFQKIAMDYSRKVNQFTNGEIDDKKKD